MISQDIKLTKPKIKNKQSLILIRLVRFYCNKLVIFYDPYSWREKSEYLSSWGNASERAVQTYAHFYAHFGYLGSIWLLCVALLYEKASLFWSKSDFRSKFMVFEKFFWLKMERKSYFIRSKVHKGCFIIELKN